MLVFADRAPLVAYRIGRGVDLEAGNPNVLQRILGDSFAEQPLIVGLNGPSWSDDDVAQLRAISSMRILMLDGTSISTDHLLYRVRQLDMVIGD